ncbi:HNH endonuclease [Paenibacillus silvae]|uniref:HNH endonuclease n=1 Tax=Paenibacillus silvae TaxID=1325358 RepID=UPI0020044D37|nr:HNH endonuclease [Paenibacillus silvae]
MTKAKGLMSNFSPADLAKKLKGKLDILLTNSPKLANALNKANDFTHGLMADLMSDAVFSAAMDMLSNYADSNILMSAMLIMSNSGGGKKKDSTNPQKKKKKKSKTDKEKKERKPIEPREFKERVINEDGTKTYTLTSKKNGKDYTVTYDKAGYPIFNSKFDTNIPESHYLVSDRKQFKHLTLELAKEIEKNPALADSLTEKELALIKKGKVPSTLTWHHHQETGKMQLVDYYEHEVAKHTGGRSIWGGGRKGRKGKL